MGCRDDTHTVRQTDRHTDTQADRQRQTETHQGMSTLPAACPGSDKDTGAPPREMERGGQRDGVRKAREEWQGSRGGGEKRR